MTSKELCLAVESATIELKFFPAMWALFKPVEVICPQWALVFLLSQNWKAFV